MLIAMADGHRAKARKQGNSKQQTANSKWTSPSVLETLSTIEIGSGLVAEPFADLLSAICYGLSVSARKPWLLPEPRRHQNELGGGLVVVACYRDHVP